MTLSKMAEGTVQQIIVPFRYNFTSFLLAHPWFDLHSLVRVDKDFFAITLCSSQSFPLIS